MKIQSWRWLAVYIQTLVVAGLPFVKVGGESALRFDIPTMRLLFFGVKLWVGEFYVILLAALVFSLLIIAFTLVLGRVWCGWACPQTVLGEYVWYIRGALAGKKPDKAVVRITRAVLANIVILFISAFVSANLIWYFVSPYEMLPELFTWSMGPTTSTFFVVMAVALYAHFTFLGQKFCGTVCPYSKWQGVLLDKNSLIIAFDRDRADECRGCDRCVTVCPTGIDIKKGVQVECINCARCVDACRSMMAKRGKGPLVGYMFGTKAGRFRDALTGKAVVFIVAVVALSAMLVMRSVDRQTINMQVSKTRASLYTVGRDGSIVNSYELSIANMGGSDETCTVSVSGIDGARLAIPENPVLLPAGERKRLPMLVSARPDKSRHGAGRIRIVLGCGETGGELSSEASFVAP